MVGPAARLTERVHVRTSEEECLDVHLLDVEFPGDDFPMHPLMAGVETAGMYAQPAPAGLLLQLGQCPRIPPGISERNLPPDILRRFPRRQRIFPAPLGCRGTDNRT